MSWAELPEPTTSWLHPFPGAKGRRSPGWEMQNGYLVLFFFGMSTWGLLLPSPAWWFLMEVSITSLQDHCHYHGHVQGYGGSWVVLSTCSGIRYGDVQGGAGFVGLMKRGMDPTAPFLSAGTPLEQHRWSCKPSSRCFMGLMFPSLPFSHPSADPRSRQQGGERLFFWQHELPSRKFVSGGGKILLPTAGTPELSFAPLQPQTASPCSRGLRSTEVLMLRMY